MSRLTNRDTWGLPTARKFICDIEWTGCEMRGPLEAETPP